MNAHVERVINTQSFGPTFFSKASAWLDSKLKARRARRIERDAIEYLRAQDRSFLDDIGIDVSQLYTPHATLASCSPHVIAITALTPAPSSPSAEQRRQR